MSIYNLCTLARWQLWPAYLVLIVSTPLGALSLWRNTLQRKRVAAPTPRKFARTALVSAGVLMLVLTAVASWLFPVLELPRPSGPFAIGTTEFHFIDRARREVHTANPLDRRALMVRVWYPAAVQSHQRPAPYWLHAALVCEAVNRDHWPIGWFLSHLGSFPTHSFLDAPVALQQAAYPALVFSHGLGLGYSAQNTVLVEELASRGYIVFAVDHPYDGLAAVFPDGRVTSFIAEAYEPHEAEPSRQLAADAEQVMNSVDPQKLLPITKRLIEAQPRDTFLSRYWVDVWSKDQRFVFDQIERLQTGEIPSRFAGHLQTDHMGIFGMSFGGSTAAKTCAEDPRCKAGINLDGFRPVSIEAPPQHAPFMYSANAHLAVNSVFLATDLNDRYFVQIAGTEHLDYTDFPLLSPLAKYLGASGSIDPHRMATIVNAYVTAFFDQYLLGKTSPLLGGPPRDYPEVRFIGRTASNNSGAAR